MQRVVDLGAPLDHSFLEKIIAKFIPPGEKGAEG